MSKVIGYHGTTLDVAEQLASGATKFNARRNGHDWLGTGIYFWQDGPVRAKVWARYMANQVKKTPAIVSAEIDLSNCLDLLDLPSFKKLRQTYSEFDAFEKRFGYTQAQAGLVVEGGRQYTTTDSSSDPLTRKPILNYRDCTVIDYHISSMRNKGQIIDSIRGCFLSGSALFPNSFLFDWSHAQIAVLNESVISNITAAEIAPIK